MCTERLDELLQFTSGLQWTVSHPSNVVALKVN